ncbi:TerC family protein [Lysobacter enzymogenes]|uniref:TerC family protein n=1 Tax=Lysobacter enzymogenes TaxID=69 RepID=UPI001A9733FE|nr:transporter associated domain-containing protein [Lysobacter enzymogenes]QQP95436.1 CBS domain-containing protein [Lysobacter enzymogenes]
MEWLSDPTIWMGLATLVVLEIVLGIDNLVFIAILADKLPPHQRDKARVIGLSLALVMRLALLATLSWIMRLTAPLFSLFGHPFSGRDLILLGGGLFLLFKATMELHERLEPPAEHGAGGKAYAAFGLVVLQIVVLDAVFSLDSVITAVGMVDELGVMFAAVIVAMAVMLLASKPLTRFVGRHPTVVVLCLGFLLMIGFSLVAEGLGFKIPKGYLYAAIAFSILIESFNQWSQANRDRHARRLPFRQRTAEAVTRLLGARPGGEHAQAERAGAAAAAAEPGLEAAEHDMIRSVLTLAERSVASVMTVRADIQWIDARRGPEHAAQRLIATPHTRLLVCDGELDDLQGVVASRDLLAGVLAGRPLALAEHLREPLTLPESSTALRALERIREHPIALAVVVNEYGGVEGLVTANDLLAAIAGDLVDTRDADFGIERGEDGAWIVDASISLEDLFRATGIALERQASYVSVTGLFLHRLERLPAVGDRVRSGGWELEALSLERRRVGRARLTPV